MRLIDDNLQTIYALCQKHKVSRLFVFGSVLTERFNSQSDVDLLVDFKKEEIDDYFSNFFDLKYDLEKLFGKEVDLVESQTVRNLYLRQSIDQSKVLIYG